MEAKWTLDYVVTVRHRIKMYLLRAVDTLGHYTLGVAGNDHGIVCNGSQT